MGRRTRSAALAPTDPEAERDYKALNGLEALESRFDDQAIKFWEPVRPSVA